MKLYAKAAWSKAQIEDRLNKGADGIEIQLVSEYDEFYNDDSFKNVDISKIIGIHMPCNTKSDYSIDSLEGSLTFEKTCARTSELASLLDRKLYLVLHFEGPVEKLKKLNVYSKLVYEVKQVAKKYPNILMCVENCVDNPFYKHSNVEFVKDIDKPNVKTCLDTCHALISEKISFDASSVWKIQDTSLDEFFRVNKDYCVYLHLANASYPDDLKNFGIGEGHGTTFEDDKLGLDRIVKFYKKYNYDCDIVLEVKEKIYTDAQNYLKTKKQLEDAFTRNGLACE